MEFKVSDIQIANVRSEYETWQVHWAHQNTISWDGAVSTLLTTVLRQVSKELLADLMAASE